MEEVLNERVAAGIAAKATAAAPQKKRGLKPGCKRPRIARALTSITDDDVLLTADEVRVLFGGPSRPLALATVYRGIADGRYPRPVWVGPNSVRWLRSECRQARQRLMEARGKFPLPRSLPQPEGEAA